jgi:hypothetical protein
VCLTRVQGTISEDENRTPQILKKGSRPKSTFPFPINFLLSCAYPFYVGHMEACSGLLNIRYESIVISETDLKFSSK